MALDDTPPLSNNVEGSLTIVEASKRLGITERALRRLLAAPQAKRKGFWSRLAALWRD